MSTVASAPDLFAPVLVHTLRRDDGSLLLSSGHALGAHPRCAGEWLRHWARVTPERPFLLERPAPGAPWQALSWADTFARVQAIGAALLRLPGPAQAPVVVLSENSTAHALLMLACLDVGLPYAALSPAYSLMSRDHAKLKRLAQQLQPRVLFVESAARFAGALASLDGLHDAVRVAQDAQGGPADIVPFAHWLAAPSTADRAAVDAAHAAVTPDTVAKILFTSGSTGEPKGVINTHRMLCASQQARAQVWPFLDRAPPVLVDWLPWNHTFGGNNNFHLVLRHGGTLYIDAGRPTPEQFGTTVANLREIAPTIYFNVPRGYDMLVGALRADAALRRHFFSRLQVMFYAGSALPQHVWDALIALSRETTGAPIAMVTSWGATETAPLATDCHFQAARSGVIGVPVPGVTLKLLPNGDKMEVRVRGPNVTPGYLHQPEATARAFDEEGFYRIGDAVRFVDPDRPQAGLLFDGRVAEDFKLATGTWVSVGALRVRAIEHLAPLAQDVVVTGHDGDEIGLLVFPHLAACRHIAGLPDDAPTEALLAHGAVRAHIAAGLAAMRAAGGGSASHATRALLLIDPPSVDAGEITDKGYINQSAVLRQRAGLVAKLHARAVDPDRIVAVEGDGAP